MLLHCGPGLKSWLLGAGRRGVWGDLRNGQRPKRDFTVRPLGAAPFWFRTHNPPPITPRRFKKIFYIDQCTYGTINEANKPFTDDVPPVACRVSGSTFTQAASEGGLNSPRVGRVRTSCLVRGNMLRRFNDWGASVETQDTDVLSAQWIN